MSLSRLQKSSKLSGLLLLVLVHSVNELFPQNAETNLNISRNASDSRTPENSRRLPRAQSQGDIEGLYREGLIALQNGDWLQGLITFEKVSWLNSEYKDVQNKLADAQFNLNKKLQTASQSGSGMSFLLILGWSLFFSALPVIGLFLLSPTARGRYYLMQGKYGKAVVTFENILSKHPEKFRIYQILANIYLFDNRKDEQALEVFEMILRLNLFPERNQEINSIVANHYLSKGRSDTIAIEVMEKELNTKIMKIKNG